MKKIVVTISIWLFSLVIYSQTFSLSYDCGAAMSQQVISILRTSENKLLIYASDTCKKIILSDMRGIIEWSVLIEVSGHWNSGDWQAIEDFSDGSFYILHEMDYTTFGVIKIDMKGKILWSKQYSSGNASGGNSLCSTSDGNILIVGGGCFGGSYLHKINTNGDLLWEKQYNIGLIGTPHGVIKTKNNDYIIVADIKINWYDVAILRISGDGDLKWFKTYDTGGGWELPGGKSVELSNGDLFVCGMSKDSSYVNSGFVLKIDSAGNPKWYKKYYSDLGLSLSSLEKTENNEIILTGNISYSDYRSDQILFAKIDSAGTPKWFRSAGNYTYNSGGPDYPYCITTIGINSFAIGGYSGDGKFISIIDSDGNGFCEYDTISIMSKDCSLTAKNYIVPYNVYTCTVSDLSIYYNNVSPIKKVFCSGLNASLANIPLSEEYEININPNPVTNVSFLKVSSISNQTNNIVKIVIYDVLGNFVSVDYFHLQTSFVLKNENYNSGAYFFNVYSNDTVICFGKFLVH